MFQSPDGIEIATPRAVQQALDPIRTWLDEHATAATILGPILLLVACAIGYFIGRRLLLALMRRVTRSTKAKWDDTLYASKFLHRLSYLIPLALVYWTVDGLRGIPVPIAVAIERIALTLMVVSVMFALASLLDGVHTIYRASGDARRRSIKGYVQLGKIFVFVIGGLFAGATLMNRAVGDLFVGIGLSTAVVLLIFKDTILSLVASIQLAANDLVRVGDWIEVPQAGADGDVIDVALHTIKVQNFDNTITTLPTHVLQAESFKNWRGMQESGARRIKRSFTIDVDSVRFLGGADFDGLERLVLLREYLSGKRTELDEFHAERGGADEIHAANNRRLTNLGTFRAYVLAYLRGHPGICADRTLLVRQLQPTEFGLPLELYAFTNTTSWADYERIQADIFDHLLAIVGEFGLRVAQRPTSFGLAERADLASDA